MEHFTLSPLDYIAFAAYFVGLSAVGYWAGRKEHTGAEEYFLAGKKLPWYVVGGSFIGSNISTRALHRHDRRRLRLRHLRRRWPNG